LIFHGINSVGKQAFEVLTDGQMDVMVAAGFNVVRLGFSWDLYETQPNVYNDTYLLEVNDVIRRLGERRIYSFIDMHQDVYAKQYW